MLSFVLEGTEITGGSPWSRESWLLAFSLSLDLAFRLGMQFILLICGPSSFSGFYWALSNKLDLNSEHWALLSTCLDAALWPPSCCFLLGSWVYAQFISYQGSEGIQNQSSGPRSIHTVFWDFSISSCHRSSTLQLLSLQPLSTQPPILLCF